MVTVRVTLNCASSPSSTELATRSTDTVGTGASIPLTAIACALSEMLDQDPLPLCRYRVEGIVQPAAAPESSPVLANAHLMNPKNVEYSNTTWYRVSAARKAPAGAVNSLTPAFTEDGVVSVYSRSPGRPSAALSLSVTVTSLRSMISSTSQSRRRAMPWSV